MNRLRGLNFGGWLSQIDAIEEKDPHNFKSIEAHMEHFLGAEDFTRVAQWGFNHVRLPIDYNYFFDEAANPIKSRFKYLDEAIAAGLANRLHVMLDLHKCPGHTFHDVKKHVQAIFTDEKYVELTIKVWEYLAKRYAGYTNTIFEVLNEPVAPSAQLWNNLKDTLFKSIRALAPSTPIVVGSNMWSWPSMYPELTPIEDDNVIYCFHFYEPLLFTHQKAPWLQEAEFLTERDYPADYDTGVVRQYDLRMSEGHWDKTRFQKELEPVLAFREKTKAPIICNEFGVYASVPRKPQLRWVNDFLEVLKENDFGFSLWNYKNLDFGIISKGESLHANLDRYNNPKRLDQELLTVLQNG